MFDREELEELSLGLVVARPAERQIRPVAIVVGKGGIRKESKRWGRGCGWKEHRPYQQHGRARVPKRVDVVDWLHGLYPGVWKS